PEILTAPPTDGLWDDNRTDESQIGAGYDELEWAMTYTALTTQEKNAQVLEDRQKQVLSLFQKLHAANRHKMDPIPVCNIPEHLRE
ncbi:MAG: NAD(+) synthase, partial [Desulfotignum sp.]